VTANLYPLPSAKPGHRFVPAKVGATNATSVIVLIECPTFCVEDHVAESVRNVEDISHVSAAPGVGTASFLQRGQHHTLWATVQTDPVAADPRLSSAHVVVEDMGGEYAYLTPEMAEQYADNLIGFASELRHLARTARQHNQANGDSDPDMDEALRRVRSGGVA
jgi:hypothetical protein